MYTDYNAHVYDITQKISPGRTDEQHLVLHQQLSLHHKRKAKAKIVKLLRVGGGVTCPLCPHGSATAQFTT